MRGATLALALLSLSAAAAFAPGATSPAAVAARARAASPRSMFEFGGEDDAADPTDAEIEACSTDVCFEITFYRN
jgi:hypothetical protein